MAENMDLAGAKRLRGPNMYGINLTDSSRNVKEEGEEGAVNNDRYFRPFIDSEPQDG
ncbi:hypothetical protein GCM10010918_19770 [Paenibacillus radicis (ex Gao et al. 2016)]|uniref:Uncharacterized protein n=1 Tax=Paenibacillus radicis (ex Gao et al. 2016) TaxID=1737354 RepID=A0A917H273_9BACL|nr:hypothetical protein GCM10010918_19770 [Paenibacillus radicis (ex Gao et al. 2016)]